MKEAAKNRASKSEVDGALDIAHFFEEKKKEKKPQTFDLSYFNGIWCIGEWWITNLFIFSDMFETFRMPNSVTETITTWKLKDLLGESVKPPITSGNSLAPKLKYIHNSKIVAECKGSCLKQDQSSFTCKNVLNFFIACKSHKE